MLSRNSFNLYCIDLYQNDFVSERRRLHTRTNLGISAALVRDGRTISAALIRDGCAISAVPVRDGHRISVVPVRDGGRISAAPVTLQVLWGIYFKGIEQLTNNYSTAFI